MHGTPSVLVGWVTSGVIRAEFVRSLLALQIYHHKHWEMGGIIDQISPYIDENRNVLTNEFLVGTKMNWMLMVDIDMTFNPIVLDRLHEYAVNGEKIIAGIYNTFNEKGLVPLSYMLNPATDFYDPVVLDKPTYVDSAPAGFMLLHREPLEKVQEKFGRNWFSRIETKNSGMYYGEDVSFCRRAKEIGYKILGVPKLEIRHLKIVPI